MNFLPPQKILDYLNKKKIPMIIKKDYTQVSKPESFMVKNVYLIENAYKVRNSNSSTGFSIIKKEIAKFMIEKGFFKLNDFKDLSFNTRRGGNYVYN